MRVVVAWMLLGVALLSSREGFAVPQCNCSLQEYKPIYVMVFGECWTTRCTTSLPSRRQCVVTASAHPKRTVLNGLVEAFKPDDQGSCFQGYLQDRYNKAHKDDFLQELAN